MQISSKEMAGWPPPSVAHLPRCSATISDLTPEARELTTSLVLGSKSASRKAALTAMDIAYTVRAACGARIPTHLAGAVSKAPC